MLEQTLQPQHRSTFSKTPTTRSNLWPRFSIDIGVAATTSLLISPIVSVIDRTVVQITASPTKPSLPTTLRTSLHPLLRPHKFLLSRPFTLLFLVYFGSYTTANLFDTLHSHSTSNAYATTSSTTQKFLGTSLVSTSLTVYKDSVFTRLFGAHTPGLQPRTPIASYILFTTRDAFTIYTCFILPPLLSKSLANLPPSIQTRFSYLLATETARDRTAQLALPVLAQLVSTPIHLLGLDCYNRQSRLSLSDRARRVLRDMRSATMIRMVRILPAFGVGGVVNAELRRNWMGRIERKGIY